MNQPILINTNTAASNKAANAHAAKNASQQEQTQEGQAFSSELDKHIDKSKPSQAKTNSSVNKSEHKPDKAENKHSESASSVDKDGKNLPDDKVSTEQSDESVVSEHVEQTESSDAVIELSESETTSNDDPTSPDIKHETAIQPQEDVGTDEVIPQGLVQTEAIHAVVHDIKQTIVEQKQAEQQGQDKTVVGKLVSDTVKNMTKPNSAEHAGVKNNLEELVQAKATTLSAASAESDKETKTAKLRPDILQALSLRTNETKPPIQTQVQALTPSEKTDAIIDKSVASLKASGQADIAELLEHRSSKTATASNDKAIIDLKSPMATQNSATATIKTNGPVLDIQPTLQNAAWDRVMTSRVLWMAREGVQQASLKLNPANLGPVEVRLNMHHEQANVTFIAQSAVTRDALEQAIPRLRESFAQNGLELTDTDVSQQSFSQTGDDNQEQAELNSGTMQHNFVQGSDDNSDQEQKIVDNEQDVELGLSIYA